MFPRCWLSAILSVLGRALGFSPAPAMSCFDISLHTWLFKGWQVWKGRTLRHFLNHFFSLHISPYLYGTYQRAFLVCQWKLKHIKAPLCFKDKQGPVPFSLCQAAAASDASQLFLHSEVLIYTLWLCLREHTYQTGITCCIPCFVLNSVERDAFITLCRYLINAITKRHTPSGDERKERHHRCISVHNCHLLPRGLSVVSFKQHRHFNIFNTVSRASTRISIWLECKTLHMLFSVFAFSPHNEL